jgi:hypothetical protein
MVAVAARNLARARSHPAFKAFKRVNGNKRDRTFTRLHAFPLVRRTAHHQELTSPGKLRLAYEAGVLAR